uniref:Uncharacterized protein n=1 Tax=Cannabis sativa TaxID=3483 RepID=A0A803QGF9_CANSA
MLRGPTESEFKEKATSDCLIVEYFNGDPFINIGQLRSIFECCIEKDDVYKLGMVLFVMDVLAEKEEKTLVPPFIMRMADDLVFFYEKSHRFPRMMNWESKEVSLGKDESLDYLQSMADRDYELLEDPINTHGRSEKAQRRGRATTRPRLFGDEFILPNDYRADDGEDVLHTPQNMSITSIIDTQDLEAQVLETIPTPVEKRPKKRLRLFDEYTKIKKKMKPSIAHVNVDPLWPVDQKLLHSFQN